MKVRTRMRVQGKEVLVSNLDKILFPHTGFTKGELIEYYLKIAPWILPHVKNCPLTTKRYPDGVEGKSFYEKHCPAYRPDWIQTVKVAKTDGVIEYLVIDSVAALIWASNLACLELHGFLHRAPVLARPRCVVFDLDPGPPANMVDCCRIALRLKELFDRLKLNCIPKTSGSKGLQIYIPLNTAATYDLTKSFARRVAESMEELLPDLVVSRMSKKLRSGKVLIDWSQNDEHKTTICVYSLRAKDVPTVSTPVLWEEILKAQRSGKSDHLVHSPAEVFKRLRKRGDLFESHLTLKQKLPRLLESG